MITSLTPQPAPLAGTSGPAPAPKAGRGTARACFRRHKATLLWFTPTLLLAFSVQAMHMAGAPQRTDDEGTYMAQAWAIYQWGELAHYTYWYDHPPLGWIQLAGYAGLTGVFDRWDTALMAGREAMIAAFLISATLVWAMARRLRLTRPASAAAVAIFALSPLAIAFHHAVYLDNIAVPWLLGAFLLAMSRDRQLTGFAGAAACFGVAVLTKETFLLVLPFLVLTMWRHADRNTRRYTLPVAASVLALFGLSYLLLAALKGEILPGANRVSLFEGMAFQLISRGSGGFVFDNGTANNTTFRIWWNLDKVILPASAVAGLGGLFVPKFRIFASMLAFLLLIIFRPVGYLPIPYVIVLFPFAALLLAGLGEKVLLRLRRVGPGGRHLVPAAVWAGVLSVLAVAIAQAGTGLANAAHDQTDKPCFEAQEWVLANVPRTHRLIVDDTMWVDFVRAGFERENILWFYKLDTDPSVKAQSPNGWKDSDYIISTAAVRTAGLPQVEEALANSDPVAIFGTDTLRAEVRKIRGPDNTDSLHHRKASRATTASFGRELTGDARLHVPAAVREAMASGSVDPRIVLALQQKLVTARLTVKELVPVAGEVTENVPPHQMLVSAIDEQNAVPGSAAAAAVVDWVNGLRTPFRASRVQETPEGVLVSFPVPAPEFLLTK